MSIIIIVSIRTKLKKRKCLLFVQFLNGAFQFREDNSLVPVVHDGYDSVDRPKHLGERPVLKGEYERGPSLRGQTGVALVGGRAPRAGDR